MVCADGRYAEYLAGGALSRPSLLFALLPSHRVLLIKEALADSSAEREGMASARYAAGPHLTAIYSLTCSPHCPDVIRRAVSLAAADGARRAGAGRSGEYML